MYSDIWIVLGILVGMNVLLLGLIWRLTNRLVSKEKEKDQVKTKAQYCARCNYTECSSLEEPCSLCNMNAIPPSHYRTRDNNYACGNCGYEGPCYCIAGSNGLSAPFCHRCGMNNKLEAITS